MPEKHDARNTTESFDSSSNLTRPPRSISLPRRLWLSAGSALLALGLLLVLIIQGGGSRIAYAQVYNNSTPITINDTTVNGTPQPATPYPSSVSLSGITGKVTKLQVTLTGLTHGRPYDVNVLLVSPSGKAVFLMANSGTLPVSNINITFDDAAATGLPASGAIASGTYKPTQNNNFSPNFPGATYTSVGTTLSFLNGTDPNGTWNLYVVDTQVGNAGSISGGWSLNLATADLKVNQTSAPTTPYAGSNITYTINYQNQGPDVAANAILTDTIPVSTTFVSINAPTGWTCPNPTGSLVNCNNPSLANAAAGTFTLVVKLDPALAANTLITNTAKLVSDVPDTNFSDNTTSVSNTVATAADLLVSKSAQPSPVVAGTDITYTLTITNAGPSNAQTVLLTDTLPISTSYKSVNVPTGSGWTCGISGANQLLCNNSTYNLTSTTFVLRASVNADVPVSTTLVNNLKASSNTPDLNNGNNNFDLPVPVATIANLGVTETASAANVQAGTNITYTVVVSNTGPSYAASATLSDPIPANTTFQSVAAPSGWSCNDTGLVTGTLSCVNPAYGLITNTFQIAVKVNPNTPLGSTITNTVAISSTTSDPVSSNNQATAQTSVGTQADIAVVKTASSSTVAPGTVLTYTLAVTNNGPSFAANTVLTDTLPVSVTVQNTFAPAGWSCSGVISGQFTCGNPALALKTDLITYTVLVNPALPNSSVLTNSVTITSATFDTNRNNNSSLVTTTAATVANLGVSQTDNPDPVKAGAQLTYSIVITNNGPSNAAQAVLSDTLPVSTTFVSITPPAGNWTCPNPVGRLVNCTNPSLGLAAGTFTLVVKVDPAVVTGTVLTNQSAVSSNTSDPVSANNSASTTTTVNTEADLQLSKVGSPSPVGAGAILNYTLTLVNAGPSNSLSVVLTDTIPTNTVFKSLATPAGWNCNTPPVNGIGTLSCSAPSVGVTTTIFTLQVVVQNGLPDGTVINNTAYVSSAGTTDPLLNNNVATAATGVNCVTNVVYKNTDDGTCGTLRIAIASADTGSVITSTLTTPVTITLSSFAPGFVLKPGVKLDLPMGANGPLITVDGTAVTNDDGFTLAAGDDIKGVRIIGFRKPLVIPTGAHVKLRGVVIVAR